MLPRWVAHAVTILGVAASFGLSLHVAGSIFFHGAETYNATVYQWLVSDGVGMQVGFLVDQLTALMMVVVTFVSLCVHVYTIGYMHDDDGYNRFFSYISLFTFSMLMLVMSNNFMQLFFGWEAVGVVSLPADRLLVQAADRHLRQPQGLPGQSRRRLRLRARHRRHRVLHRAVRRRSLDYVDAFKAAPQIAGADLSRCRAPTASTR